ncbi:hypothetical protein [Brevibacillus brevis]|uniref:hypothetical protein n=1 Tax=Brevibacillus brevis TaxID=1393 RepID=UPI00190218F7|nr:hypothetical protein [Brevibacillus brevis]
MNISLNISTDSPAELKDAIIGLAGVVGFVQDDTGFRLPAEEKPKQQRRNTGKPSEDKLKADQQEEPKADPKPEKTGAGSSEGDEEVPDIVEVRAKAQNAKTPEARAAVKALLEKYGAGSLSEIEPGDRRAFMDDLDNIIAS